MEKVKTNANATDLPLIISRSPGSAHSTAPDPGAIKAVGRERGHVVRWGWGEFAVADNMSALQLPSIVAQQF